MSFATTILKAFFLTMGLVTLVHPSTVLHLFSTREDVRNEIRAVYGGFGVAVAIALVIADRRPELRPGVLLMITLAMMGMAAGRLVAPWEIPGRWPRVFFAVELGLAFLAWKSM